MAFSLLDLLQDHPDLGRLRRQRVDATLSNLQREPSNLSVAGACLGHSYDAIEKLVEDGSLPDLLPSDVRQDLCERLRVHDLNPENLLANKDYVAGFLGMQRGVEPKKSDLPNVTQARYPLFPHQRRAVMQLRKVLSRDDRALVHMPTGAGKTRTMMNFVCEELRRHEDGVVLWLASTRELCEQAVLEFSLAWGFLGNREVPIVPAWGGRPWAPGDLRDGLLVSTPQTMHHRKISKGSEYLSAVGERVSLIVFDEAHQAIAPTYSDISEHVAITGTRGTRTPIIGLSATPGRSFEGSKADDLLVRFFHGNKVTLDTGPEGSENPVRYLIDNGYLAEAEFVLLNANGRRDGAEGVSYEIEEESMLHMDPVDYMELVVRAVEQLIASGHERIIVFAAGVSLAEDLAAVLRALGVSADSVHGGTRPEMRAAAIERYRSTRSGARVLVNYGVLTTGFDAPQTSGTVIARPTQSLVLYSQMVGRAIRGEKAGGNKKATVVTVVDPEVPAFGSIASAFGHWEDLW